MNSENMVSDANIGPYIIDPALLGDLGDEKLVELLTEHHELNIVLPRKDMLCITLKQSDFGTIGLVNHIAIFFCEYCEGGYDPDDTETDHHYLICNTEYFDPNNMSVAVEAYRKRYYSDPTACAGTGERIEVIAERQNDTFVLTAIRNGEEYEVTKTANKYSISIAGKHITIGLNADETIKFLVEHVLPDRTTTRCSICPECHRFIPVMDNDVLAPHRNITNPKYCAGSLLQLVTIK